MDCLTKPLPKDDFLSLVTPLLFRKPGSFLKAKVDKTMEELHEACNVEENMRTIDAEPEDSTGS